MRNSIGPIGSRVTFFDHACTPRWGWLVDFKNKTGEYTVLRDDGWFVELRINEDGYNSFNLEQVPGKKLATVLREKRKDGHVHYAVIYGRKMLIAAGCRHFTTLAGAVRHWKTQRRLEHLAYSKTRMVWVRNKYVKAYNQPAAVARRALDKVLNKFSIAFARKAERIRAKN